MVNRRTVMLGALGAAVTGSVAACGSGDSGSSDGKLRFLSLAWQKESLAVNKRLVEKWNSDHPDQQVEYIQGAWASAHDQLLTSFEGGDAPDIIHYEGASLGEFAKRGYLADLSDAVPAALKSEISDQSWETVTVEDKIVAVPFLLESQVIVANKKLLDAEGVAIPAADSPWTWDQFATEAKKLTSGGNYGVAWALKSPTNRVMNLALNFGGKFFYTEGGKTSVKFDTGEQEVPRRMHQQIYVDKSASPDALGLSGTDTLPGFFAGKYAMVPGSVSLRQQMVEQAPQGFEWVTLPVLKGQSTEQAANPQTLSVSADSPNSEGAMEFIAYFLDPANMAELAHGDWLIPTGKKAGAQLLSTTGGKEGWDVAVKSGESLVLAPFQQVDAYPEWKTKIANPALQEFFANKISLEELGKRLVDGGEQVIR